MPTKRIKKVKKTNDKAGQLKRKMMLEALRKCKGLVTYACKAAKISRNTHYEWLKKHPDYAKAVDEIEDFVLDKIEDSSLRMIEEGKTPAMNIFYLKTKGKKRGFVEKQQIEHSTGDLTSLRDTIRDCGIDAYERDY